MGDFLGELLDRIDTAGQTFAENAFTVLSTDIVPLLRAMFILYVLYYGIQLILGTAKISVSDIVLRIVRALAIVILISSWGDFNAIVYSWITTVPESAGRAILAASNLGVTEPTNGLSQIWKVSNESATQFSKQSGYFTILPALFGFLVMFVAGFFIAVALAILVLAKVMMWILVGTAPIFLSMFLFDSTRGYAMGWLNQVFLYALIPLFVYTIAAFLITAANTELANMTSKIGTSDLQISDFAPFLLITFAGAFVMLQVQTLAGGITGATGADIGGTARRGVGRAISAGRAASGSLGIAGSKVIDSSKYNMGMIGTNKGQQVMRDSNSRAMERAFKSQKTR
jgi:type IV secretion system protein VirB6